MSENQVVQDTIASLEKLQSEALELFEVARGSLLQPEVTEKAAKRSLLEICTSIIEKVCAELPKEEAMSVLCE